MTKISYRVTTPVNDERRGNVSGMCHLKHRYGCQELTYGFSMTDKPSILTAAEL